ncbi:MAG: hypothetical protein V4713_10065, partial [Pseudomonadota bacterium]
KSFTRTSRPWTTARFPSNFRKVIDTLLDKGWIQHSDSPWGAAVLFAKKKDGTIDLKILPSCTLPLTGVGVVNRIITDLAVLDVTPQGLKVVELAPDVTREELQAKTGVPLI